MHKRHLHYLWKRLRVVRPWYFLVAAIIFGTISIVALRNNYQHMTILRQAVYQADKDNTDVGTALSMLRDYVVKHMNTNLASGSDAVYPPIQLKYTYDRLVQAQSAKTAQTNAQLYTEAQAYCQQQNSTDFSGRNRVPCISDYVNSHGAKAQSIPDGLYKFSFASPRWSPDLAGWSLLLSAVNLLLAILVFASQGWLKRRST